MKQKIIKQIQNQVRNVPKGLSLKYYQMYNEQNELFNLINNRGVLFFR
jgi:hypothetical protein